MSNKFQWNCQKKTIHNLDLAGTSWPSTHLCLTQWLNQLESPDTGQEDHIEVQWEFHNPFPRWYRSCHHFHNPQLESWVSFDDHLDFFMPYLVQRWTFRIGKANAIRIPWKEITVWRAFTILETLKFIRHNSDGIVHSLTMSWQKAICLGQSLTKKNRK